MSKILRMELRRNVFFPLTDPKNNNLGHEELEKYIDENLQLVTEHINSLRNLVENEEHLKQYCNLTPKDFQNFDEFKRGFTTAIDSLKLSILSK